MPWPAASARACASSCSTGSGALTLPNSSSSSGTVSGGILVGGCNILLLPLQDPAERLDDFFEQGPPSPCVHRDLLAVLEVCAKVFLEPRGHGFVADGDVHLVIMLERSVIEIRGAHHDPQIIHVEHLCVGHAGTILVDPDAFTKQLTVFPARH